MKKTINESIASQANILIAVFVWIAGFLLLYIGMRLNGLDNKLMIMGALLVSAIFAFGDYDRVAILKNKMLLFRGTETGERADPGFYFTFWFWSLDTKEEQTIENLDVVIPAFQCQDKTGKSLTCEGNGDWHVDDSTENFKLHNASKMEGNLTSLVKRTIKRVLGSLPYRTTTGVGQIQGEELGSKISGDPIFQAECTKYGVQFHNLIVDAIASDLAQENINSYYDELYEKELKKYPVGHTLTHQQQEEIEARIQIKVNRAKKIISNAPLLGRFDV